MLHPPNFWQFAPEKLPFNKKGKFCVFPLPSFFAGVNLPVKTPGVLPSPKLTNRTWKWMVQFPFWVHSNLEVLCLLVSGSVLSFDCWHQQVLNWWLGLVLYDTPESPWWKGLGILGIPDDTRILPGWILNHRAPNHQNQPFVDSPPKKNHQNPTFVWRSTLIPLMLRYYPLAFSTSYPLTPNGMDPQAGWRKHPLSCT